MKGPIGPATALKAAIQIMQHFIKRCRWVSEWVESVEMAKEMFRGRGRETDQRGREGTKSVLNMWIIVHMFVLAAGWSLFLPASFPSLQCNACLLYFVTFYLCCAVCVQVCSRTLIGFLDSIAVKVFWVFKTKSWMGERCWRCFKSRFSSSSVTNPASVWTASWMAPPAFCSPPCCLHSCPLCQIDPALWKNRNRVWLWEREREIGLKGGGRDP